MERIRVWLVLVVIITAFCGLVFAAVQQVYRQTANDPQIQLSEDTAAALTAGQKPESLIPASKVDLTHSLAPFLIIYNQAGEIMYSSADLNGITPTLPKGIFDYIKEHGQDQITWQPKSEVRIAAVITPYQGENSGYVLAGRSLRQVEMRVERLQFQVGVVWLLSLTLTFFLTVVISPRSKSK